MKVAVIYPSPSKEDKEIILRAFEAYKIPISFYSIPSFDWKEVVKKERIIAICCCGPETEKVKDYLNSLSHKPVYFIFPLAKFFKATAGNSESRKQIASRLALVKHELDDLEDKIICAAQEITLDKEELTDLTYQTIMSLRNSEQAPIKVRMRTTTGEEKILKITTKKEIGAFTFEELLGVRLLVDLMNAKEVTIIEEEDKKKGE